MSFSACYPCMEYKDPIRLVPDKRVANPTVGTKVFIEVQVREKRVYRTKSGILLNHLHVSPPSQAPMHYLLNWKCFQINLDNLLAKDVFRHCCDANSLSAISKSISSSEHTAARFLKFFKRRVSSFCHKKAANLIETKPKFVVIVTPITTVCVYDLASDCDGLYSLKDCDKSCIREENPYGATLLPRGAFLFSPAHGSLAYTDSSALFHRKTCAVCLDELLMGTHDVIITACGHAFHSRCLIPWFNKVGTCPVCRGGMKLYALSP